MYRSGGLCCFGTTYLVRAVAPGFAERTSPAAMRWGIYVFVFVLGLVIMAVAVWQMLA